MVRHHNECYYCELIDDSGLFYRDGLYGHALCRDCLSKIPTYIPKEQNHDYLMRTVYGKRTIGM